MKVLASSRLVSGIGVLVASGAFVPGCFLLDGSGFGNEDVSEDVVEEFYPDSTTSLDVVWEDHGAGLLTVTGTHTTDFSLSANGTGSYFVDGIEIDGNSGTVDLNGVPVPAVVTHMIEWTFNGQDWVLFTIVAPENDNLTVMWLYCIDGDLEDLYYESFSEDLTWTTASGTCISSGNTVSETVTLLDLVAVPSAPTWTESIQLEATGLQVVSGTGTTTFGGGFEVVPFAYVDCLDSPMRRSRVVGTRSTSCSRTAPETQTASASFTCTLTTPSSSIFVTTSA